MKVVYFCLKISVKFVLYRNFILLYDFLSLEYIRLAGTLAITPSEIQTKILILRLQWIVLGFYRYSLDSEDSKHFLEAQKRLGKSRIRTCDHSSTPVYVVKSAIFNLNFLRPTWYYVDETKTL